MPLLSCADALALLAEKIASLTLLPQGEELPLAEAAGRVLAAPVRADRDQPPFPRSTRDGYAVCTGGSGQAWRLVGAIRAGEQWSGPALLAGEAIEIMTGAPVPQGADAVVMLEHVVLQDGRLSLEAGRKIAPGENVVPQAAEARADDTLLAAGTRIGPAEVALAASVGAARLGVFTRPVVAIVSTGDELVEVDEAPGPMQIRNSNAHGLAAMVQANGGRARVLPPAADTRASLQEAIQAARGAAMLVLSGGVSAGKYDFVEEALLAQGAEFFFTGVAMQPGKPAVFGRMPAREGHAEQWIFGLPGNPVSTQVTALLFAMPMLRALGGEGLTGGARVAPQPFFAQARLAEAVEVRRGLTRFLPALLTSSLRGAEVRTTGWQGSGDLNANARANCYLVVPPDAELLDAGSVVAVLLR